MYYQVQKSVCMQNSATVGRTDTMDYVPCTLGPPHCKKVRKWWILAPPDAHRIAATAFHY